jgi:HEAT repeat protein
MQLFKAPSVSKLKARRDVARLWKTLQNHKDAGVRRDAAEALGELADTQAIGPLIGALRDPESNVVQAAIDALVKFGSDSLPPLLTALGDHDMSTRAAAAWALGQISEGLEDSSLKWRATEMLIASLRDDHELVREAAVRALAKIADPRTMRSLRDALTDAHMVVRIAAVYAIAQVGLANSDGAIRQQAIAQLAVALDDNDLGVRQTAARAIGELGPRLQNGALKDSIMSRLTAALNDRDSEVCETVADALGSIGSPRAVKPLFGVLLNQEAGNELARRALEAIVSIGAPAAEELKGSLLDQDQTIRNLTATVLDSLHWVPENTSEGAAYWLAKRNWSQCVRMGATAAGVLSKELANEDYETRIRASQSLVEIGKPAALALLDLLRGSDAGLRERAAGILDQIGWEPGKDEVGATYWVTKGCWEKAAEIGDPAIAPLVRALREGDFDVRQSAAGVLHDLNWQPLEPEDHAQYAVMAHHWDDCRSIGGPAVDPLITTVLLHDDEEVKRNAACVLAELAQSGTLDDELRERLLSKYDVIIAPYYPGSANQ